MKRIEVTYFDETSDEDPERITEETLKFAKRRGDELGITHFVIVSSTGFAAKKALDIFSNCTIVFVGEARDWYDKIFLKELESKKIRVSFSHEVAHWQVWEQ